MTHACSCGHDLDEHRPHFGQCLAEHTYEDHTFFCGCRGFERQVVEGDKE